MKHEKRLDRILTLTKNIPFLLFQSVGCMFITSDNIIPYGKHTWIESYNTMILYCLFIEANYYVYHRFIHKYYYGNIHKKHHENIHVYPFDTFHLTQIDDMALVLSLGLPLAFIKISMVEHFLILYIYITTSYLSHSELFWHHHSIHHRFLYSNFCILVPIFDILFGTYKIE
jgi:sterol desaturase/sphingolipid hydroxylase (fatty acid hydroxylase superfamily)